MAKFLQILANLILKIVKTEVKHISYLALITQYTYAT